MKQFLRLIIPEKIELIFGLSLSLLLIGVLNIKRFWLVIMDGGAAAAVSEVQSTDSFIARILTNLDSRINPNWLDYAVWLMVGCLAFMVFSILTAAFKTASDEVAMVEYYSTPNGKLHEMIGFITKISVRMLGLVGGLVWLDVFLQQVNPYLVKVFFVSLTTLPELGSFFWLVLSVLLYGGCLYIFVVCVRLVALKIRIFN